MWSDLSLKSVLHINRPCLPLEQRSLNDSGLSPVLLDELPNSQFLNGLDPLLAQKSSYFSQIVLPFLDPDVQDFRLFDQIRV